MREERIREELRRERVPGEEEAAGRSWEVVRAAMAEHEAVRGRTPARLPLRLALAVAALGVLALALALTPAGAAVREWVAEAIDDEAPPPRRALTHLPAPGELLVASRPGVWLVREDGTRRLLGDYEEASFSPHGLNVVASERNQLVAVSPEGELRWSISGRRPVADARWAPSGYRVAYREGRSLKVIVGDASEPPRTLAERVAPLAPAWRPSPPELDARYEPNVLAYADPRGRLAAMDVDSGRRLWRTRVGGSVRSVEWITADRLLVATDDSIQLLDGNGRPVGSVPVPKGAELSAVTPAPGGERLAIVLSSREPAAAGGRSRLVLARIAGGARRQRTVFSGLGRFGDPVFSPDGETILLPWTEADQWLFIAPSHDRKLVRRTVAVADIARQFDPGRGGGAEFPEVGSWCCG